MHSTRVNGQYSHFCRPQNGTLRRFRFPPTCETHAHERKQRARAASDISDLAPFSAGLSLAPVAPERFHGGERRCETAATFATWHFLDGLRRVRRRYGETTATADAAEREVQSVRLLTQTFSVPTLTPLRGVPALFDRVLELRTGRAQQEGPVVILPRVAEVSRLYLFSNPPRAGFCTGPPLA